MPKKVIEIPEGMEALGEAFEAILVDVRGTMARTGGGKAVDYAQVEAAVSEDAARVERTAHQAILQSLDIDVPAVIIGGGRYVRGGRAGGAPPRPRGAARRASAGGGGGGGGGEGGRRRPRTGGGAPRPPPDPD